MAKRGGAVGVVSWAEGAAEVRLRRSRSGAVTRPTRSIEAVTLVYATRSPSTPLDAVVNSLHVSPNTACPHNSINPNQRHPAALPRALPSHIRLHRPPPLHLSCPLLPSPPLSPMSSTAPSKADEPQQVQLMGAIGFNGSVPGGVLLHPDDARLFYPLGSTIVVKHLHTNAQHFLSKGGHDHDISALALSPCGRFLASGQSTHMGFTATVIAWDLSTMQALHKWPAHKGRVQSLSFSADSALLASIGGRDDMKLLVFDLASGQPLCGATAANDSSSTVRFLHTQPDRLITGGSYSLRTWTVDRTGRKLTHTDCQLGQLKRIINDIAVSADDRLMHCATTTGDVLCIDVGAALYKGSHPSKLLVQGGLARAPPPLGWDGGGHR